MNATKIIVVLALAVFLITACSSKIATTVPAETTVKKPSLELKVYVSERTATVSFKTDITISPQHYGKERVPGEGHMHLYLDDDGEKKVSTEDKYVFKDLTVGMHKVKVSLHNNDHTPYNVSQTKEFEIK
ncbi:hypothetical protein [Paenibacillus sp. GP183]|uniref:hypothetical protein n=1 Tax=Paenibacillus sp. GP183 TaxID=1882751 RepID=UPI00089A6FCB|nr:hypothetical protein [Paenibacillus sp. GP183]SEB55181.1 hypothetical protein SAMN05443246_1028 [Paenibacillus sp. GP183]